MRRAKRAPSEWSGSQGPTGPPGAPMREALGGAALVLLLLLPTLLFPFGRDQATFAYIGDTLARGGMPYHDAWDLKPPGIYLLYALLARLAPDTGFGLMLRVRVADLLFVAATGALLAGLARRWGRPEAGPAAAAAYAALYLSGTFWSLAQAETWATPLVLGAILAAEAFRREGRGLIRWALPGALAGAAALLKFPMLLPAAPFLLRGAGAAPAGRGGGGRALRGARLALLAAGAALPLLAAAAWLAAGGAWAAYLEIQRGFVAPYARLGAGEAGLAGPALALARATGHTLGWLAARWPVALLVLLALAGKRRNGRREALLLTGGGFLAVWAQDKYFGYHWQAALPGLALLAGMGASALLERFAALAARRSAGPAGAAALDRSLPAAAALLLAAGAVAAEATTWRDALRLAPGALARQHLPEEWLARFQPPGRDFSFVAGLRAAEYVRAHTRPGDPILVWGFEPEVYLLSGRRAPTRFFFDVPLTAPFAPPAWREEFLADLRARPPELFLVLKNDRFPWANGRSDDSAAQLEAWPELRAWLAAGYQKMARIEDFTIYRRTPGRGSAPPPGAGGPISPRP